MYNALYGRQSVEKKDSISVESQLEYCRYEAHGEPCLEYTDKGFSGKNTRRPGFEKMMADIAAGKIKRVIVYKLDRISRSILDFANMMEFFASYQVEFVSSTEKFDTSTPIGRAMLNICIVFAQLERETIQKRVRDAYYARSKRGFYMGGRVPYGYRLEKTVLDGISTSMYAEIPEESRQLALIFSMYADPSHSLGDIVRHLNSHGIRHLRGAAWNTARLSELLRNPVYVKADAAVYDFFRSQGVKIHNPIQDFTGENGCYLYKSPSSVSAKSPVERELVLAPHKGFIRSELWLACRKRCLNNSSIPNTGNARNSWLSGKVRCRNCGYALTLRKSKSKWGRYFVCSHQSSGCPGTGSTIYADVLEEFFSYALQVALSRLPASPQSGPLLARQAETSQKLQQVEAEIRSLLSRIPDANQILMNYVNLRITELDEQKRLLEQELNQPSEASLCRDVRHFEPDFPMDHKGISGKKWQNIWEKLPFQKKQEVLDLLIDMASIGGGVMDIQWRIPHFYDL